MNLLRRTGAALAIVTIAAVAAAGCGGEETDVSGGIDSYNERLQQQGIPAELKCPDRVDGGEGTEFECTLEAAQGGKSEKITMEIQKEGDDLVVTEKDQAAFERAVQQVVGAQQQPQQGGPTGQGGQQPQQPQQPGGQGE